MARRKEFIVIKQIILVLIISLCLCSHVLAEERVSIEDKLVSSTLKVLAKAFVAIVDIDKLKKNNIDKLNKMDKDKFEKRYAKVYRVIEGLPYKLKVKYGVTGHMVKEIAIKNIASLDKKTIYEIIDLIPDRIIADQFKQYLHKEKAQTQNRSLIEQVNGFWDKMIRKVNIYTKPYSPH